MPSLLRRLFPKKSKPAELPYDIEREFTTIYEKARPFTMTSLPRMYALHNAVKYVTRHRIEGDIVECGVWRGGSMMMVGHTLVELGDTSRRLFLYDTYTGMSAPTAEDVAHDGMVASEHMPNVDKGDHVDWCYASLEDVSRNVLSTGYPETQVRFVKGKVEDTIPGTIPEKIAILRLDTDFYESTKHELAHLYPRLSKHGLLIIDDYGYWRGCRQAVDEWLDTIDQPLFLNRVDSDCRIIVKPN